MLLEKVKLIPALRFFCLYAILVFIQRVAFYGMIMKKLKENAMFENSRLGLRTGE
jgi:hypothetical protein